MTNITLQKQHRTLWHFIPRGSYLASAVITGVALWGGSIPAVAGAEGLVPSPSQSCWGWF